ncbi:MAG: hypothetical protein U0441_33490 [Polyangiaceae bacterium]
MTTRNNATHSVRRSTSLSTRGLIGGCALVLGVAGLSVLSGCGGSGGGSGACEGQSVTEPFQAVGKGDMEVGCIQFSGGGQPLGVHIPEIRFTDGTILELRFPVGLTVPKTYDLAGDPDNAGADVINYEGFEGGDQSLCDFTPKTSAVAGTLALTSITVGQDGFLDEMHGTVDVSFTGCTIESLKMTKEPLQLKGTF